MQDCMGGVFAMKCIVSHHRKGKVNLTEMLTIFLKGIQKLSKKFI